jgi:hypothetical protein
MCQVSAAVANSCDSSEAVLTAFQRFGVSWQMLSSAVASPVGNGRKELGNAEKEWAGDDRLEPAALKSSVSRAAARSWLISARALPADSAARLL